MKIKLISILGTVAVATIPLTCTSCTITTAPDGTETKRVDQAAVNPWLELARDLLTKPAPPVAPIIVDPEK